MTLRTHRIFVLLLPFLLIRSAVPVAAQVPTGGLVGSVTDPTQAVVPGARVTVRNVSTNLIQTFTTGPDGLFRFPALPVGTYEMSAEATGFRRSSQTGIHLGGVETVRLNVRLELGEVSSTVEVVSGAVRIETESSTLRGVVDPKQVSELPLVARDVAALVLLVPGTVDVPVGPYQGGFNFPGRRAIPSNGGRGNMVNYSLDGSNANDNYTNVNNPLPNPDVVREMVVQTNSFSAKFGQSGSAQVNVVTKSGTNSVHGSAFEYLRNGALNAQNAFTHRTDGLKRNQFGFSVGGPIWIPTLYNGKNRTFFFASYQGTRERQSPTGTFVTLPTAGQRQGDLSQISKVIKDPATGLPFPDNQIPVARMSTFAKKMFDYIPVPQPLAGFQPGATYITVPQQSGLNEVSLKVDHQTRDKNQLSARYYTNVYSTPASFPDKNLVAARQGLEARYVSVAINDTHAFRPTLVNQFIASYDRTDAVGIDAAGMSARDDFGVNIYAPKPSRINYDVSGYFGVATGGNYRSPRNTFQYADNLNYIQGRHQWAFGTNISRMQMALDNPASMHGYWSYDGSLTGNQLGDFLLGKPNYFKQNRGQFFQMRGTTYGFYAQDDWKATRRLTLNLGVRYEPYFPFHEKRGMGVTFAPGQRSVVFPLAPAGLLYEGDPGVPRGHQQRDVNNLAPRVGFAFDPSGVGKWSIRGGYGIAYDINPTKTYIGFVSTPPFSTQVDLYSPSSDMDFFAGLPGGNPFPMPPPTKDAQFPAGVGASARDRSRRLSYVQSWNLTLERELIATLVGRISYAGSKGTKLETGYEGNPAVFIPGSSTTGNTSQRRLYASAGLGAIDTSSTEGLSLYHSLQAGLQHRFKDSLSIQANYVFSKSIDNISVANGTSPLFINPFNKHAYRAVSDFDATHRFVVAYIWNVPAPQFRTRLATAMLRHWSVTGIASAQTGLPMNVSAGQDRSLSGVGRDLAELVGNPTISNRDVSAWFNTAAFALPPFGSFGNSGRNILRAPGFWNLDFSLAKDFPFAESTKVQFRSEFFNAPNNVNLGTPNTTVTSPSFARVTGYRGPRIIQLSMKLLW